MGVSTYFARLTVNSSESSIKLSKSCPSVHLVKENSWPQITLDRRKNDTPSPTGHILGRGINGQLMKGYSRINVIHFIQGDTKDIGVGLETLDDAYFYRAREVSCYPYRARWIFVELEDYEFTVYD
ncbi:unnamed protein product [Vicia faba]|uniref:Uncharacterized protein n=1 Tax=Vicia faba TaxID=3906 RepID=A0AAV1A1X3_VICFA|nr:unnamed protein product [Vicia faba]